MRLLPRPSADTTNRAVIAAATATAQRTFDRATRKRPCLICGRTKFCVTIDGRLQLCTKIAAGSVKASRDGSGWIHVISDAPHHARPRVEPQRASPPPANLRGIVTAAAAATPDDIMHEHAVALGVPVEALRRLGAFALTYIDAERLASELPQDDDTRGRLHRQLAWTIGRTSWLGIPMHARGRVVGVRLRNANTGDKLALVGGREGLFVPASVRAGLHTMVIVEGPSDTAALLGIGIEAIGRPNCCGAVEETTRVALVLKPRRVGVLADRDPAGIKGAVALAKQLAAVTPDVRVALPPRGLKDARAWVAAGATANHILASVEGGRRV